MSQNTTSAYKQGCQEEAKRWDRIARNGRDNPEYARKVAARWREKAAEAK